MNSNTIVMRLLEKEVARSRGLFQYDYGQRLVFTGVELPDAYEVHFSNNKVGVSKTVIGDATGVDIPDEFLLKGDPVYVWVFLHTGDTDGETEYHGMIDVIKRAKPVHDKPTPVQQDEITQAIAVLNAAVTTTGQDVVDATVAKDAAEAAQAAAEEAQGIADDARDEAVQAKNAAVSAAEAAEASKDAAVEAKEISEEIAEALPGTIEAALQEAKDSGEFDGATFVPSIDDGVISWTNDRQLPNPDPVDIAEELELGTYAKKDEIPTKVSELTNDSGYLTTETDPTVSAWAKQPNKPSYTAQEVGAIDVAQKGTANGVAELGADGKVKSGQLPSYVDDVAEYDSISQFPATGESGKIYIAKDTNITYRWGGSSYVPIGSDLALGETASTAYRGDRGKIAYDHASAKGNAYANGLYKIATNAEGHVTGATPVAKSDITGLGIPGSVPTKTSELQNDSGFITTETDPTVASWAKEPTKPTYTASEVGLGNVANERQYSANNPPPADTTKQDKINVNGILKGTGNGGVTAAVEGTDYISGDIIAVQDETPTDPNTQIWLPETQPESVQVASYAELTNVLNALNQSNAATNSDIGKAHSPKTVVDGKVTEWQYLPIGGSGLTADVKDALLQCFDHVTWDDAHWDEYYADLYDALYPVVSITAVYDSTHTATTADTLASLKPYLTVTAHREGVADETVTDYVLSGTLTVGTSTITVSYKGKQDTFDVNVILASAYDIVVFAGQSNMDGRGDATEAPTVAQGTAFKWDRTNNTIVDFAAEPSLIPAYVKEYYEETSVPIVEIKEAEGGLNITQWMTGYLPKIQTDVPACKAYLESIGKTVRNVFMVWNQGENDVYDGTTTAQYEASFTQMKSSVMSYGVEKIFIIDIGQVKVGNYDFTNIRTALQNVCNGTDVVMVSDKFYHAINYMKDQWHYNQIVYNAVGKNAAQNTVSFYTTGVSPTCMLFDASDVYGVPDVYMDLATSGWQYWIYNERAVLHDCSVESTHVRKFAKLGDAYYIVRLPYPTGGALGNAMAFINNSVTKNVVIDQGVVIGSADKGEPGEYGLQFAYKATALESIDGIPAMGNGVSQAFYNTSKLLQEIDITNMHGSFNQTFYGSGITAITGIGTGITGMQNAFQNCHNLVSVCDLNGSYTSANGAFDGDENLESVGVIGSTSLTNINSMFYGCIKLGGIVKFMSSDITNAQYAFWQCDLTKIEIQVPANSTTYTTITTAYPNANVTTF